MVDYKLIGKRIKESRNQKSLTQENLAEQCNITIEYISRIENGKAKPTVDTLGIICDRLSLDMGSLFSGVIVELENYNNNELSTLYQKCKPEIRTIAFELMDKLSKI